MDFISDQDPRRDDIKTLVTAYEEALANNRQPMIDQDAFDQIVGYYESGGHYDKALRIVDAALEQHPYSGLILLKKAQLLFDLKISEEALDCLDQAELFEPGELGTSLLRSEILTFLSRHMEALEILDRTMDRADEDERAGIWLHMADVYEDWEKFDEVYACLKECLLADMVNEEALSRINYCMEITDQFEDGIVLHKKIIEEHPYCFWAWYNLSFAYSSLHLYELAVDALLYVVAIDEDVHYAYRDMAQYYHELGRYREALDALETYASRIKPDADTLLLEGKCYFELNDLKRSRYCFRKAIRTKPTLHEAFYNLGMTFIMEEKWVQASQQLKNAVEQCPDQVDYLQRLAEVSLQIEDYEEVRFCCTRAIRLNSGQPGMYVTMALSNLFSDEADEAIDIIDKGIASCRGDIDLRYMRAALLLLTNKRKAAFLELEFLLAEHPESYKVIFRYFPFLSEDNGITALLERFDLPI
jgi:tetratricopeptide (TPR) repeat protein